MMHSIRYSWAKESLQFTTCSSTPGRTICEEKKLRGKKKRSFFLFIYLKICQIHLLKRFECLGKKKYKTSSFLLFGKWMLARQQRHTCLYFSTLTPSSWLSRTRLVPTRILNSCRSFSLFSLSRLWPWCCILTHNLFISAKFRRTKSTESLISPVNSSESLWSKGWTSLTHQNFQKHNLKCRGKKM